MFYGLNSFIKRILPKRFFYRSLIIVAAPIVLGQIIITVVFLDSIWIKANKGMTKSLSGEVRTIVEIYKNENKENINLITNLYSKNFDFVITFKKEESLPSIKMERKISPMDRSLRRELKMHFDNFWFDTKSYKEIVDLRIKINNDILQIFFPKNKIAPSSVRIFVLWVTLPSFLLIFIAIIFLKNQTRPIINLAKIAEKFGRGDQEAEFRPSGALEIRQAGYEFERMRKRISAHLNQRSEMLSGISHDLRTPLTRLKLQLAFLKEKEISQKMSADIDEMEKMLNEYLDFSSSRNKDKRENFDINILLQDIIIKYLNKNIYFVNSEKIKIYGNHNAIKRVFVNIIDNALTYGKKIEINSKKLKNQILIFIEDDGPGIPVKEYVNVFKAFYRIDKSRSQNKSGVGLGLSIANDIIKSHGGSITLSSGEKLKGLKVKISLPY
tara:strand:- start:7321 stop:8640 length:1320 start_codon:yes stop_codon:yes gene_type:complete